MASILPLKPFLLLVCLSVLLPQLSGSTPSQELDKISTALSDKGYKACMSSILQGVLSSLLPSKDTNTTFTIFCPPDKAFFAPEYPQPPLTLLQYHIVPSILDRESLESSLSNESKIDTLVPGHPLLVTTTPHSRNASINDVKVTEWDIYNDGRVIVHGVEHFFDPLFWCLSFPSPSQPYCALWYPPSSSESPPYLTADTPSSSGSATSWAKDKFFIVLPIFYLCWSRSFSWMLF
ncbi:hypothetical protein Vadar_022923 [Vaccinium darrowii]|uniref:Uncharacterized protein n=1 Tax=Vaccinium darrowii TaxID=229202 RepID=A0ACB7Z703_9ERIC|nr:hypothetical protein Vadar_022923 [Vaccinium darrowii]